jgi:hypothetical protein
VRLEDRQVAGDELEQDLQREKSPLEEKRTEELDGLAGDELRGHGEARHEQLLEVMRALLEGRDIAIGELELPERERRALEALQAAITGRSTTLNQFVYAEDRRTMLEQALAVLQPDLISQKVTQQLEALTSRVTELREQLMNLEDSQADTIGVEHAVTKGEAGDTDDEPVDPDAPKPASTLSSGPEVKHERAPSTLTGGREVAREAAPTTLGDAAEIAAAAKQPWWKRVFGG